MDLDISICNNIAEKHRLPLQFVVKEHYVYDVLAEVMFATSGEVPGVIFKGGTALNKVYLGELQRFSEDLDFDLDLEAKREEGEKMTLEWLTEYLTKEITKNKTFYKTEMRKVKDTIQIYCKYTNPSPLSGTDTVRIDIAPKNIITENKVEKRKALFAFARQEMRGLWTYSLEDLVARKMHALRTGREGKDFYDVYNALPKCRAMFNPIKRMLQSEESSETPEEFIEKTIENVEGTDYKRLRNLTNPFIPISNRPKDWLELKNDLILKLESINIVSK